MHEIIIKYNLSPNQYFFLRAMFYGQAPYKIHIDEMKELDERSFILMNDESTMLIKKGNDLFDKNEYIDKNFKEIWELYPSTTPNGRILKPKSLNTQIGRKAFNKLKKHLTNYNTVEQIKNSLRNELKQRAKSGGLNYMKHINTWINQEAWSEYVTSKTIDKPDAIGETVFDVG